MEDLEKQEGQETPEQKAGKIKKKFDAAMTSLTLVLGGQALYKPDKLLPKEIQAAVVELAKDEKKKLTDSFKEKAVALIQEKRTYDKEVAKIDKEAAQKKEKNMEDFTKKANDLFGMLKDINNIEKDYYDTLLSAEIGKPVEEVKKDVITPSA